MKTQESIVDYYLAELDAGQGDNAYHSLIEADPTIIPILIDRYEASDDIDTKRFIIRVVSEFRLVSPLGFLGVALRREEPQLWKAALDGLATAELLAGVNEMADVLASVTDRNKRSWIEEAITDTSEIISKEQNKAEMATPRKPSDHFGS